MMMIIDEWDEYNDKFYSNLNYPKLNILELNYFISIINFIFFL